MARTRVVSLKREPHALDRRTSIVRLVLALIAAIAVYVALSQSIYWMPALALGAVMGAVVGTVMQSAALGAAASAVLSCLLMLLLRPWFSTESLLSSTSIAVGLAAITGGLLGRLSRWSVRTAALIVLAALCTLVIVNAVVVNQTPPEGGAALYQRMDREPAAGLYTTDTDAFLKTFYLMHEGAKYYPAYRQGLDGDAAGTIPFSPFNIREPLLFWLWRTLPDEGHWIYVALLPVACATLIGTFFMVAGVGGDVLALISTVLLMPAVIMISASELGGTMEPWALAPAIASVALAMRRTRYGDKALWGAVAMALLAALIREIFALYLVAALVSAAVARDRRGLVAWAAGTSVFAVAFGTHYLVASNYVARGASGALDHWLYGGLPWLLATMRIAQDVMAGGAWVPVALVVLGLVGIVFVRRRDVMLNLLLPTALPLIAFLFVGVEPVGGQLSGAYWGLIYAPLAIACAPLTLLLFPGLSEAGLTEGRIEL